MDVDADMGLSSQNSHSSSRPTASPRAPALAHHSRSPAPDYPSLVIRNVHLPFDSDDPTLADPLYNVFCLGGRVDRVELATPNGNGHTSRHSTPPHHPEYQTRDRQGTHAELDAQGRGILLPASVRSFSLARPFLALTYPPAILMVRVVRVVSPVLPPPLPSLCHAHIHLDKCFLLDQCDELVTGNFSEALRVTSKAKSAFLHDPDDLFDRGRKLVAQSVEAGVTMMRAHVEVDESVHFACVDAGLRLRRLFRDICHVQLAVFAQDPFFASAMDERPGLNYVLLQSAARRPGVEAVGSAPYVEPTIAHAKRNIDYILDLALEAGLHVDFHLDYNLEPGAEPLIWYVLDQVRARIQHGRWRPGTQVCVGHATRLTLFSAEEWARLRAALLEERLPVTLVGLPPSDLYMMGRGAEFAPRGTLNVPRLAAEHGLRVAMAVNNVENAFTPQGQIDPLALCPLGVAVFQAGTKQDCRALLESVTLNARLAIGGVHKGSPLLSVTPAPGQVADFVLMHENDTLHAAALNPCFSRTTIRHGQVVARRVAQTWILPQKTPSPEPLPRSPA